MIATMQPPAVQQFSAATTRKALIWAPAKSTHSVAAVIQSPETERERQTRSTPQSQPNIKINQ